MVTSWRLPPCPPVAAGSLGLGPARRQRRPERRHGDQGTEGQHPVGSMPENRKKEESYQGSGCWRQNEAVFKHINRHSFHTISIFST